MRHLRSGWLASLLACSLMASILTGVVTHVLGASSLIAGIVASPSGLNEYRLTLTTALPVTTADVTGASAQTIYCTPYTGDRLSLYDGTATWQVYNPGEFNLPLGTLADGTKPYDVFCFASAGAPTLEFLVWTSTSVRATALVRQNGVWCKTGALTRRYMGTFMPMSTTQTEDSINNRYLFNASNRVTRHLSTTGVNATYAYTTATWRSANADAGVGTGRFNLLIGLNEELVQVVAHSNVNLTGGVYGGVGIALDATNANNAQIFGDTAGAAFPNYDSQYASYKSFPGVGQHFIQQVEIGSASQNFNNTTQAGMQTGMVGTVRN